MLALFIMCSAFVCVAMFAFADGDLEPIKSVEIGDNREFRVNGKPFLPIMLWAQSLERLDEKMSIGVNTFAGSRGDLSPGEYMDRLAENGAYAIRHFSPGVPHHSHLLGWIQSDEPDLFKKDPGMQVVPAKGSATKIDGALDALRNGGKLDGPTFEPLQGAAITLRPRRPVTAAGLSIWVGTDAQLSVVKELSIEADGREVCRAALARTTEEQRINLAEPVTFAELTLRVLSVEAGTSTAGRINLIDAHDPEGGSAFGKLRVHEPRMTADEVSACYHAVKEHDAMRPVLMTFTSHFMSKSAGYSPEMKLRIYPEYVKSCDVVGFDTYPIFGWNKPENLRDVADGTAELCAIAGPKRAVYAWIETNAGSRWIDPAKQIPVTPADTRAEVWMAIIQGATAIGYFTHSWWPEYDEFAPGEAMKAELKRLDAQITRLAPAILAAPAEREVSMTEAEGLACHLKATQHEGALYVFAQNMDMARRRASATIAIEGLKTGTPVEVVDEGRALTAGDGEFADEFGPLAEHIYRITGS